jgi:hypothetical protein
VRSQPAGVEVALFAGSADIPGFLVPALQCLDASCRWIERTTIVTPAVDIARSLVGPSLPFRFELRILPDEELAPEAVGLPDWFRQQYLKLNADRVVDGNLLVCMGADTLVLEKVNLDDLVEDGRPLIRFFDDGRRHMQFELDRVKSLATALQVGATRSAMLVDFICDFFPMEAEILQSLRAFVASRIDGGLLGWLRSLGPRDGFDNRFGEWTLYALYALDVLGAAAPVRNGSVERWAAQVHSRRDMERPDRYDSRIVHFAWKEPGAPAIIADLDACGRLPGTGGRERGAPARGPGSSRGR